MTSKTHSDSSWGSQYRLFASEEWKAKSAAMGWPQTHAEVHAAVNRYSDGEKIAFGALGFSLLEGNRAP
jgi:hypothetical protein